MGTKRLAIKGVIHEYVSFDSKDASTKGVICLNWSLFFESRDSHGIQVHLPEMFVEEGVHSWEAWPEFSDTKTYWGH